MSHNTKSPNHVDLSMFTHAKCLYRDIQRVAQLYCPLQDMDNVQNAVNPLSVIYMHCVQFTPVKVHNNTGSLYSLDISSKTQVSFLIASKYYVHVWSGVQSLYIVMKMSRRL